MLVTCLPTCCFTWGFQRPFIFYLKAYLVFPPQLKLLSIAFIFFSSSQVPRTILWALICLCKLSHDLLALMGQLKGAPMLICACHIHAACLSVLLLKLSLRAFHWLVLGVAHFLLTAKGFTWLPFGPWLPQCLFVFVRHL